MIELIAVWVLRVVCGVIALYGMIAVVVPTIRPLLRHGGQVRWPAFVCLMMSTIFLGFLLMTLLPNPDRLDNIWLIWAYFSISAVLIGWAMWRERIGKSAA